MTDEDLSCVSEVRLICRSRYLLSSFGVIVDVLNDDLLIYC